MLNKVCHNCQSIVELDESDYQPGESVSIQCQLCGENVVFTIPEKAPQKKPEDDKPAPAKVKEVERPSNSDITVADDPAADDHKEANVSETQEPAYKKEEPKPKITAVPVRVTARPVVIADNANEASETNEGSNKKLIWIIVVLILIVGGIFGGWYYTSVYIPEKIDREAPRYFTLASPSLTLRSTKDKDVEHNKITALPFGTKLIVYDIDGQWAKVKVDNNNGEKKEGYVSTDFILNPSDFKILNSIYGNKDAREIIESGRTKKALLQYYKDNDYIGNLTSDELQEIGLDIVPSRTNQWQVFCDKRGSKANTIKFQRLINAESKYQDMGVIIENIVTGDRKFLYFTFDDRDESPSLYSESPAPKSGNIKNIVIKGNKITPKYE